MEHTFQYSTPKTNSIQVYEGTHLTCVFSCSKKKASIYLGLKRLEIHIEKSQIQSLEKEKKHFQNLPFPTGQGNWVKHASVGLNKHHDLHIALSNQLSEQQRDYENGELSEIHFLRLTF